MMSYYKWQKEEHLITLLPVQVSIQSSLNTELSWGEKWGLFHLPTKDFNSLVSLASYESLSPRNAKEAKLFQVYSCVHQLRNCCSGLQKLSFPALYLATTYVASTDFSGIGFQERECRLRPNSLGWRTADESTQSIAFTEYSMTML